MAELIQFQRLELPTLRVIGKSLTCTMGAPENPIPAFWQTCFSDGTLQRLEALTDQVYDPSYVGFMCDWTPASGTFRYVVGMLMKAGTPIPEGYDSVDLAAGSAAVGWIKGKEPEVYVAAHTQTEAAMLQEGLVMDGGRPWSMELYNCPRFTMPDENGDLILDYYIPCKDR